MPLEDLLTDRTHGASEIEERLLEHLLEQVDDAPEDLLEDLLDALVRGVHQHQPSMANLLQLAHRARRLWTEHCGEGADGDAARETLAREWRVRLERLQRSEQLLGREITALACELWGEPKPDAPLTILTLSRSGAVRAALAALAEAGYPVTAAVGEGRPGNEGRELAAELRRRGVDARLVTDAAVIALAAGSAPAQLLPADPARTAVVVGADAVGPRTFVNKVGTRALASAARERNLPVLLVADAGKDLPPELFDRLDLPAAPAEELDPPTDVPAIGFYFETVPLALVTRRVAG